MSLSGYSSSSSSAAASLSNLGAVSEAEKRNTLGRGIVLALPSKSRPCGVVLCPVDPHSLVLAAVQGLIHAARSAGMAGRLAVLCQFSWPTFQSELLGAVETLIHADDPELWVHKISEIQVLEFLLCQAGRQSRNKRTHSLERLHTAVLDTVRSLSVTRSQPQPVFVAEDPGSKSASLVCSGPSLRQSSMESSYRTLRNFLLHVQQEDQSFSPSEVSASCKKPKIEAC